MRFRGFCFLSLYLTVKVFAQEPIPQSPQVPPVAISGSEVSVDTKIKDQKMVDAVGKVPKTYTVKTGDTLWDLSQTFFGDPFFWPKMWSMNADTILNPHLIYPDQVIHFSLGSDSEPPKMSAEELENSENQKLVPQAKKSEPVPLIPSTLPGMEMKKVSGSKLDFDLIKKNFNSAPKQWLSQLVEEQDPQSIGEIISPENGYHTAGPLQNLYIQFNSEIGLGEKLLVLSGEAALLNGGDAKVRDVLGWVEVEAKVKADSPVYRAKVIQAIHLIPEGAIVVRASHPEFDMSVTEGVDHQASTGVFVTVKGPGARELLGVGELGFVNAGQGQGLRLGGVYTIYRNPLSRSDVVEGERGLRPLGYAKVVQQTQGFSTLVIVEAKEEIRPGDTLAPVSQ